MDRSTDRRKFIEKQTQGLSKPVVRITGVLVTDEMLMKYTRGSKRGAVGCFLAHRNAMKELLKKGWERALILEDDGCLNMSSRWPKKLSELKFPSWLSQGTTAYIITPSIARDFLERTEGLTDLTKPRIPYGVDHLIMAAYGNNPINEWSDYPPGNWGVYPYVYPAAHLFETQIQSLSKQKYFNDCERSVRIIKALGGGLKMITLHWNRKNVKKSGFPITNIIIHTSVSRSQALKLRSSKEGLLEIYIPVLTKRVFEGLKNVKIFEIPYSKLIENSITARSYSDDNQLPKTSFHVVVVCTPNYDHIGRYGISMLTKYCRMHGYELSVVRDAIEGLHVNFTKNSAAISTLKSSKADYIVNIDADVVVKDFGVGLADIIVDPDAVLQAPRDYWGDSGKSRHNIINAGCVLWKNCHRAIRINEIWLEKAKGECNYEATHTLSRQQNTFDKCVIQEIEEGELAYIDHNLVGLPHSSVIAQADGNTDVPELQCSECRGNTKDTSKAQCKKCKEKIVHRGWLEAGSPPLQQGALPPCFSSKHEELGERVVAGKFTPVHACVLKFGGAVEQYPPSFKGD